MIKEKNDLKGKKKKSMIWLMRWLNRSITTLNDTSQFLDIYINRLVANLCDAWK